MYLISLLYWPTLLGFFCKGYRAEVVSESEFEVISSLGGAFPKNIPAFCGGRPVQRCGKYVKRFAAKLGVSVGITADKSFRLAQGFAVKGGQPSSKRVDKVVEF